MKLSSFYKFIKLIFFSVCVCSCTFKKQPLEPYVLVVDTDNMINTLSGLEIYFLDCKAKRIEKSNFNLTGLLKSLDIEEVSGCHAVAYHNYQLIPNQVLRDLLYPAENSKQVVFVAKEKSKVLAHKVISLPSKNIRVVKVKLLGRLMKVTVG